MNRGPHNSASCLYWLDQTGTQILPEWLQVSSRYASCRYSSLPPGTSHRQSWLPPGTSFRYSCKHSVITDSRLQGNRGERDLQSSTSKRLPCSSHNQRRHMPDLEVLVLGEPGERDLLEGS